MSHDELVGRGGGKRFFARGSVFEQAGRAVLQNFKKVYEMTPQKYTFSEIFEKFQNFYLI